MIDRTVPPLYYAVIFTPVKNEKAYREIAILIEELAKTRPGYLGVESARDELGINLSCRKDLKRAR